MKIYKDKERKEPLKVIHFGIVKAGESKTITVYLYNESEALLTNLKFLMRKNIPEVKQIKILDAPVTIQPKSIHPLKIKWSPSRTFKKALEITLFITGEEVFLAKRTFSVTERRKK